MSAQPNPAPQSEAADRIAGHSAAIEHLINAGLQIVDQTVTVAKTEAPPEAKAQLVAAASAAYDRVSRAVRRCILLSQHLHDPVARAAQQRTATRKRILREVEDRIHRDEPRPHERECLRAELLERLDSPDLDDDIATLPPEQVVLNVMRDLDIGARPGEVRSTKRRTPEDIALLCARAAKPRPTPQQPAPGPGAAETTEELQRFLHQIIAPKLE